MKTIGLLGGLSWESSAEYYRIINQEAQRRLGGVHSAEILLWSFDFEAIKALQMADDWDAATARMVEAAQRLERGGAGCLVICSNTMHRMAPAVQAAIDIPLIHIADPTAAAIQADGLERIGLLGTRFTMEGEFYAGRLRQPFGLTPLVPDEPGRTTVHDIIYQELVRGIIRPESRQAYVQVIDGLAAAGAQGIILGCTEIGLLVKPGDHRLPLYDTTQLHALAALDWAMGLA
jgi:aspartate racemase